MPAGSLSARRAWIEMPPGLGRSAICTVALRKESVDRNIPAGRYALLVNMSLSARRAWIEMHYEHLHIYSTIVALRKESVDRNNLLSALSLGLWMSLSARRAWIEISLDGWDDAAAGSLSARRAWIEMILFFFSGLVLVWSLSARRAWIEMRVPDGRAKPKKSLSARRAWIEMRDRRHWQMGHRSLSARRAWIEISIRISQGSSWIVALRKESVDRNDGTVLAPVNLHHSRSPQGERG